MKKYFVARGGRDLTITQDYNQALLIAQNIPSRVHEFSNYHIALKLLQKMVDSAINHSEKPTGDFIHLDVSVNNQTAEAEFRVMQGDKYLVSASKIQFCTPNLAEFLALTEAYKYAQHFNLEQDIYCDNMMAIKWFKKKAPVTIPPTLKVANPKLEELVDKAVEFINTLPDGYDEKVLYWDKSMWGEIPSDYQRKRV